MLVIFPAWRRVNRLPTVVSKQSEALQVTRTFNLFAFKQTPERLEILTPLIDRALDALRRHLNSYLVPVGRHKAWCPADPCRCVECHMRTPWILGPPKMVTAAAPAADPLVGCLVIGTLNV